MRSRSLLAAALLALATAPLRADAIVVARLTLEPGSTLTRAGYEPAPLAGSIVIRLDAPTGPTALELLEVSVYASGLLEFRLDPSSEAPGLGVLFADDSFLIPTLFLAIDSGGGAAPVELAIPDVEGTIDTTDPQLLVLETGFDVETEEGVVGVAIVAAPEPGAAALAGAAATALACLAAAAYSSRRASATRGQRSGSGWPSRSRKISRKR